MVHAEVVVHYRLLAVRGTARCDVCTHPCSWVVPVERGEESEQLEERIRAQRCPRCKGSLEIDGGGLKAELEVEVPGMSRETILAPLDGD